MSDAWHLTILLLSGIRLMRPEKAWRPIVTIEVEAGKEGDGGRSAGVYETLLGVDGQCVNQRESMVIYDAAPSSKVAINVWHRSQSKKKKRRVLVANASCCIGELMKKQEGADGKIDVRLMCRSSDSKASSAARGRPQGGAVIRLKLRAPPSPKSSVFAPSLIASTSTSTIRPTLINAEAGPSRSSTLDSVYTDDMHINSSSESVHTEEGSGRESQERPASPLSETSSEKAWFGDEVPDLITSDAQSKWDLRISEQE